MKDERWILDKIEKNASFDVIFPAGFSSSELPEWCNSKTFNKLSIALLAPGRSILGLELRSPLILSLSDHQRSVLAVVILSFYRVASPECFKPWHALIIDMIPAIPHDALDLILHFLACDIQFRHTFFSKSGSSGSVRGLATSFALQVSLHSHAHGCALFKCFAVSRQIYFNHKRYAVDTVLSRFYSCLRASI
jgi:hypothetical protein